MKCWGVTCDGLASHPGGVAILLVTSCYENWDKLRQLGTTRPGRFCYNIKINIPFSKRVIFLYLLRQIDKQLDAVFSKGKPHIKKAAPTATGEQIKGEQQGRDG